MICQKCETGECGHQNPTRLARSKYGAIVGTVVVENKVLSMFYLKTTNHRGGGYFFNIQCTKCGATRTTIATHPGQKCFACLGPERGQFMGAMLKNRPKPPSKPLAIDTMARPLKPPSRVATTEE